MPEHLASYLPAPGADPADHARAELVKYRNHVNARDYLVCRAVETGISVSEIHRITGIARSTINRILEQNAQVRSVIEFSAILGEACLRMAEQDIGRARALEDTAVSLLNYGNGSYWHEGFERDARELYERAQVYSWYADFLLGAGVCTCRLPLPCTG